MVVSVLFSERPDASPTSRPRHVPRLIAESTSLREKEQVGGIDVFWATPEFARATTQEPSARRVKFSESRWGWSELT